jgi:UDP-glucose 4-epimerase
LGTVVEVICEALERRITSPTPVNLAFGSRHSLLEVITLLEGLLGHEVAIHHIAPRAGDVRDSQADSARLRALFPTVRPTPLEEGLNKTLAWTRDRLGTEVFHP